MKVTVKCQHATRRPIEVGTLWMSISSGTVFLLQMLNSRCYFIVPMYPKDSIVEQRCSFETAEEAICGLMPFYGSVTIKQVDDEQHLQP
jgi:hypothetical protein